jgi:hypothetical protein
VVLCPDVVSYIDSRFDCRNLLQRSVIHHGAGREASSAIISAPHSGRNDRNGMLRSCGVVAMAGVSRAALPYDWTLPAWSQSKSIAVTKLPTFLPSRGNALLQHRSVTEFPFLLIRSDQ